MIKQNISDPPPTGFAKAVTIGDEITYYFDGDIEVIQDQAQDKQLADDQARYLLKLTREKTLTQLNVTTAAGNQYDANEVSQNRMCRVLYAMNDADVIDWVLLDNSIKQVSKAELSEALKLAVTAQTDAWQLPKA